ncbi:hypothetical protein AK812_SmicGene229 [Symbiodinium microadriaticum]|uniref:Uncharacterized protein n=1 Tax=Symbiodinium microadriaticum TaxID=2951 RepID=A0A1Q9F7D9_SYMMI|nr:hypothetical protein AK812_SmicGene229 [Symbiodinium microadriaticum]
MFFDNAGSWHLKLRKHLLHLMALPGPQPSEAGRGAREEPAAEAPEAPVLQELALLVSRLAAFAPPALPVSTAQLLLDPEEGYGRYGLLKARGLPDSALQFTDTTQRNAMLRLRGFRFLGELPSSEGTLGQVCQLLPAVKREEAEAIPSRQIGATGALQTVLRNAAACDGMLRPALLTSAMMSLRLGLGDAWSYVTGLFGVDFTRNLDDSKDANASVRTSAVQALAALAPHLPQETMVRCARSSDEGSEVVLLVLHLASDAAGDVAAAVAKLCSDTSDKAIADAMLPVGVDKLKTFACPREPETGVSYARVFESFDSAVHGTFAELLVEGVQRAPAKCQWNACRSAGQLLCCAAVASHQEILGFRFLDLRQHSGSGAWLQVSSAENLKVRIQATEDIELILSAACDAVDFVSQGGTAPGLPAAAEAATAAGAIASTQPTWNSYVRVNDIDSNKTKNHFLLVRGSSRWCNAAALLRRLRVPDWRKQRLGDTMAGLKSQNVFYPYALAVPTHMPEKASAASASDGNDFEATLAGQEALAALLAPAGREKGFAT